MSILSLKIYALMTESGEIVYTQTNVDPSLEISAKDISEVHPDIVLLNDKSITIKKTIYTKNINLAHGNPTFLFKVKGLSASNKYRVFYVSICFTKEYIESELSKSPESKYLSLSKTLNNLDSGEYEVFEVGVSRYSLSNIQNIKNGQLSLNKKYATLNLTSYSIKKETASLDFLESDYKQELFSHNDIMVSEYEY